MRIVTRILLVAGLLAGLGAAMPEDSLTTVRRLAIQHNGRHKPFDSFAREVISLITGEPQYGKADPVETVLSMMASPERWQDEPLIAVPLVPLREALGLSPKTTHVSFNELVATRKLMRMLPAIVEKQRAGEKLSMLENEAWDAYQRFVQFNQLVEHDLSLIPPPPSVVERSWLPILAPAGHSPEQQATLREAWTAFVGAVREPQPTAIATAAGHLADVLRAVNPSAYPSAWRLQLEVFYNRAAPFRAARLLYLVAFLGLLVGVAWRPQTVIRLGTIALWVGFIIHGAGIVLRVVLGGRPPVSNFFETMLWLPFVAVALALVFERIYRVGYFGMAASVVAAITLLLADHLPLDPSISPVVAVLRSNLWLTVHVLTIVASYGALTLATALAHVYGGLYLLRSRTQEALSRLDTFLYRAIQVGVVLLAGGVMLGAVWANASWGRYWGWDPKETWALITLLWFLAILHGRFAGWIHGVGVALATIGGFFLLLMTYYGVSFYLVGLHSYAGGHAKPLPPLLIAYLIAELAFLAIIGLAALSRRRPA